MELMHASRQWASRPDDERFLNLYELGAKVSHQKAMSRAPVVSSRAIQAVGLSQNDLQVVGVSKSGKTGNRYTPTNWAFGQLSQLSGAPASYLRKLDARLAADCINYGLTKIRDVEEVGLLITEDQGNSSLRAATGPRYGRVWNEDIVNALIKHHGDGRTGRFRVPGEFGEQVEITKRNTTIYGSDRDMFVFLADEENRVEVPNRRNGRSGSLAKGFFMWNSEVGDKAMGAAFFLFDYTCSNRIVWGAQDFQEIRIRHTVTAPDRWLDEIEPVLEEYADAATASVRDVIVSAQQKKLDKSVEDFFANRQFTGSQITQIKHAHELEEGRPIETLWDAVTGVTAFAKTIEHQDNRVAMERLGGKLLELAA